MCACCSRVRTVCVVVCTCIYSFCSLAPPPTYSPTPRCVVSCCCVLCCATCCCLFVAHHHHHHHQYLPTLPPTHHQISDLPARELVPGDVVELHTGGSESERGRGRGRVRGGQGEREREREGLLASWLCVCWCLSSPSQPASQPLWE